MRRNFFVYARDEKISAELDSGENIPPHHDQWMADKYGEGKLAPAPGTTERALYYQWILFAMASIEPHLSRYAQLRSSEGDAAETEREAKAAASLEHANIVPVYAAGELDGQLFIAMRLVAGGDLGKFLREHGRLPLERTLSLCAQLAAALLLSGGVGIWLGSERAVPTLLGGLIGVVPNAFLAARVMSPRARTSARVTRPTVRGSGESRFSSMRIRAVAAACLHWPRWSSDHARWDSRLSRHRSSS